MCFPIQEIFFFAGKRTKFQVLEVLGAAQDGGQRVWQVPVTAYLNVLLHLEYLN